ncbi:MAG TPA: double-cubane-cluster-containing anaerobic reductase [Syntrophales bacterium]|jgi:benzoyl-CoA reductase/2-hydroxyglutaryl-CoA dehydratase subunit BcrC/BadD/HgdB|nr:double-cubane-cluster-containing anaerobic reductase [Syntrophales bacterium]
MSGKYTEMWRSLGLNLEAHQGLLAVLSDAYKGIYLSQKNRPEGMKYFDLVISEVHGQRIVEIVEEKIKGKPVFGTFCIYVPEELILAVDGVSIGLCAGADVGAEEAEKYLPRNTCALIKAFMGFKLAGLCPYVESSDLIIGETTCDGKKKAYEILNEITGKVHVMEMPHMKSEEGKSLWMSEVKKLAAKLTEVSGKEITLEKLNEAAAVVWEKRRALQRLSALRAFDPVPISGLDALLINQVSFYDNPVRFTQMVNALCDELEVRVKKGMGVVQKNTPRIVISGSPMAIPNWKLHAIIEGSGAVVVGEESCVGERNFKTQADPQFPSVEQGLEAIAERYLTINCACFTPNEGRLDDIQEMAQRLHANGVIHYALQFCTPYMVEAYKVKERLGKEEIPYLRIETDYSMEDMGQLKTRVEAFIEVMKDGMAR